MDPELQALAVRIAFWAFAAIAVVSAIAVVANKNPVACAMSLVTSFVAVSGLYMTLGATFLSAAQILVYAGAIMVLFLFVIMLLNLEMPAIETIPIRRVAGIALVLAFLFGAAAMLFGTGPDRTVADSVTSGEGDAIGRVFAADYVFPFEMASLLLLVAMVGAIVIARKPSPDEEAA